MVAPVTIEPEPTRSRRGERVVRALAWPVSVFAANAVLVALLVRIWVADMRLPFTHVGDELFSLMTIKDVVDHGWFLTNPDLGAPFGQQLYDFAGVNGDSLTIIAVKVLGVFTSDAALIQNLMFVLSFPAIAVITFLVLRALDIAAGPSAVAATLFALAPFHFLRGESHFFLSLYYAVPLGGYLVMCVFGGRPLFARREGEGRRGLAWASRRTLATLAICVIAASGGVYYATFTLMLLLTAIVLRVLVTRRLAAALAGCAVVAMMVATLVVNQIPTLIYQSDHGVNELVGKRFPFESETYSLKLVRMVLPAPNHRFGPFARLTSTYAADKTSSPGEFFSESLGGIATIGFVWLLVVLMLAAMGSRAGPIRDRRSGHAAIAALLCFLVGTTGGLSSVIAYTLSPQLRGWVRISIVISFFALIAVALLLELLVRRVEGRRGGAAVAAVALVVVLLAGLYDQTNRSFVPPYSQSKAEYGSDRTFVAAIERAMPHDAAIYQLPYTPFPRNPRINELPDQDLLRPYLQSTDLRWSYAAMKGRPEEWVDDFYDLGPEQVNAIDTAVGSRRTLNQDVAALVASGFDGIYIDRFGYADGAAAIEAELGRIAKAPPLVSPNNRMSFFNLLGARKRLAEQLDPATRRELAAATLHPLVETFGAGFYPAEPTPEGAIRYATRQANLVIDNPRGAARARFVADVTTAGPDPARVTFRLPDGSTVVKTARSARVPLRLRLLIDVRPGRNVVAISTDAPRTPSDPGDLRELYIRFGDPHVDDLARTPPGLR